MANRGRGDVSDDLGGLGVDLDAVGMADAITARELVPERLQLRRRARG